MGADAEKKVVLTKKSLGILNISWNRPLVRGLLFVVSQDQDHCGLYLYSSATWLNFEFNLIMIDQLFTFKFYFLKTITRVCELLMFIDIIYFNDMWGKRDILCYPRYHFFFWKEDVTCSKLFCYIVIMMLSFT